ncbi:DUF4188 domain-containing protein [Halorubrum sp. PV6]|uniref:DUF4188 domain-containing protein n=1 Tax=Halorubrum sp. PV6 TaxID=634157 RepID=UPI001B3569D5|nr:DUF4188 domain-containing protein [Halorubrum sp. PV6]
MSRLGRLLDRVRSRLGRDRHTGRVHADRDESFVVFLIGMRINAFWKVHRWLPVFLVAPRMVRELRADDDAGLLGSWTFLSPPRGIGFVQYWEDFESLRAYARDSDHLHLGAWDDYARQSETGAVGIWHETYRVDADSYETVYNNGPPRGLGVAAGTDLVAASGRERSAAGRLDGEDDPLPRDA